MKKVITLFLILLIPSMLYLVLTTGKHRIKTLEYFGPIATQNIYDGAGKQIIDTIYHTLPPFVFERSNGMPLNSATDLKDKIFVVNLFYTQSGLRSQQSGSLMKMIQDRFINFRDVKLLSITVDPERDSIPALLAYQRELQANDSIWYFLRSDIENVNNFAQNGLLISGHDKSDSSGEIMHSNLAVLVDRARRIRGYYDTTDVKDMKRLIDELKVLIAEYNLAYKNNINPIR